jgi:hypothetical protein
MCTYVCAERKDHMHVSCSSYCRSKIRGQDVLWNSKPRRIALRWWRVLEPTV